MIQKKNGIVVVGAIFVDIKGFPQDIYVPDGRNAGYIEYIHGGVARNVVEDIANLGLNSTFVSIVDNTALGEDVKQRLQNRNVNTDYMKSIENGMGTWLAVFDHNGELAGSISHRPNLMPIYSILEENGDAIIERHERTLITTLTVRMAEDLTSYLKNMDLKVAWLHHEVTTIERTEIIHDLRQGKYDVLVGINLLREGLDIPEVSLIAILDADKEGFLRSRRSLIQIIGRAARNAKGKVIMYADKITESMQEAMDETARRRSIQMEYNEKHGIVPKTIIKPIHDVVRSKETKEMAAKYLKKKKLPAKQKEKMIKELEQEMKEAARTLDFERAAQLRDILFEMKGEK